MVERDRWAGRWTFVIATIGAAVGLGNFWRFPGLTFTYGGFGNFIIPYLCALFFFGIPLCLMELGLGQKFQSGDVTVFRNIHPRLAGIGMVSVSASYIIALYYIVMIGWACVYFVASCQSPLPWSSKNDKNFAANCAKFYFQEMVEKLKENAADSSYTLPATCGSMDDATLTSLTACAADMTSAGGTGSDATNDWLGSLTTFNECPQYDLPESSELGYIDWDVDYPSAPYLCRANMRPAREFFRVTVTREYNPDNCKAYADGDPSTFSVWAMVASLFVWICVFLAIFNGVKSSSYVIWVTVPIPVCFIFVMLFHGLTLDGSKDGIK